MVKTIDDGCHHKKKIKQIFTGFPKSMEVRKDRMGLPEGDVHN